MEPAEYKNCTMQRSNIRDAFRWIEKIFVAEMRAAPPLAEQGRCAFSPNRF
jgi:hypothetical protein